MRDHVTTRPKLPKYCSWFGRYIYFRVRGDLVRMPDDPLSKQFADEYKAALASIKAPVKASRPIQNNELDQHFKTLETGAKQRARRFGREYSLPRYWGADTYHAQRHLCAVSGLIMRKPLTKWDPHGPSIDRINSDEGYTPENCHLVTYAVNRAKNTMTEQELVDFCKAVVLHSRRKSRQ